MSWPTLPVWTNVPLVDHASRETLRARNVVASCRLPPGIEARVEGLKVELSWGTWRIYGTAASARDRLAGSHRGDPTGGPGRVEVDISDLPFDAAVAMVEGAASVVEVMES